MMKAEDALLEAFASKHPTEAAELLGEVAPEDRAALLARLAPPHAARLLSWMTPLTSARALEQMDAGDAKDVLDELGLHVAASALRGVGDESRRTLLGLARPRRAEGLRRLLRYPPESAGGLMDPLVLAVPESIEAGEALERVRQEPEAAMYYVYALGEAHQLTGVASLRELMMSAPDAPVDTVMRRNPAQLIATAGRASIVSHPAWHRFFTLPVVDRESTFLGAIRYETMRSLERELGRASREPDETATASALAEFYGLGLLSMAEWAVATLRGSRREEER